MRHARNFEDLTGRRFGRLVVIDFVGKNEDGLTIWRCRCDCGKEVVAYRANLVRGFTKSCGCLRRDSLIGNKRNAVKR